MKKPAIATIEVKGTAVSILTGKEGDYISLTDMLKAKDGEPASKARTGDRPALSGCP